MERQHKKTWQCDECRVKRPKGDNSNTPVRSTQRVDEILTSPKEKSRVPTAATSDNTNVTLRTIANQNRKEKASSSDVATMANISEESLRLIIKQEITDVLKTTIKELISYQLNSINELVNGFHKSLTFFNSQFEEFKKNLQDSDAVIKNLRSENENLQCSIYDLSKRMNSLEQLNRSANVEIQCDPEKKSENLFNIVENLGNTINCPLGRSDILNCIRVAKMNPESPRPRSILVQLSSPLLRNTVLAAGMKFNRSKEPKNKLNTGHLGLGGEPLPIYLVEHLSSLNKTLHAAARKQAKEQGFKFVGTRGGHIYMGYTESSDRIHVRNLEHLKSIKQPTPIVWKYTNAWLAGNLSCKLLLVLRAFGLYLSSNVLVCISIDRFFAVMYPLRLHMARRRCKQMLSLAWISALTCSLPQSIVFRVMRHPRVIGFEQCVSFDAFSSVQQEVAYNVFCLCAMYFVPLVVITVCYLCIFHEIHANSKEISEKYVEQRSVVGVRLRRSDRRLLERARRRTLRMTVTIVAVFALCWLPYATIAMWYMVDRDSASRVSPLVQDLLFAMAVSNSCMNPLVYGSYALDLRGMLKRKFSKICCIATAASDTLGNSGSGSSKNKHHVEVPLIIKNGRVRPRLGVRFAETSLTGTELPRPPQPPPRAPA